MFSHQNNYHFSMGIKALNATRERFTLGSANIAPIVHDKIETSDEVNISDRISVVPSLFEPHNIPARKNVDALIDDDLKLLALKRIQESRMELVEFMQAHINEPDPYKFTNDMYSFISNESAKKGGGNCAELAAYAFFYLAKEKYKGQLEFASFTARDHDFLILNRPKNSDPTDWKTWGEDVIIVDPWLNKIFTADQFEAVWRKNIHLTSPKENTDPLTVDSMDKLLKVRIKFDQDILSRSHVRRP